MADKVLRFTAEDSGYGQTIDRMAGKLRSAFSNTGMSDILQEADAKFTNFSDKIKYIKTQLGEVKEGINTERKGAVDEAIGENMRTGYKRTNDAVGKEASRAYEKEERSIDRLIVSLDRLGQKVEDANDKEQATPEEDRKGGGGGIIVSGRGSGSSGGGDGGGGGMGVGMGAFLGSALGGIIGNILTGVLSEAKSLVVKGVELARTENQQRSAFQFDENAVAPYELGVSNSDYIKARGQVAFSRRTGGNVDAETLNRLQLQRSNAAITDESFTGLDKFYRKRQFEGGDLQDRSQFDASRTISEILSRADRQGILGVSKTDFTMLPEKIGQVTSLMQQQYAQGDRTNANTAINLMLAGQHIGGRFADDRAAATFGKLSQGISNPNGPGSKAFILEALRRTNPGMSPLELEAQMQNGLSEENMKAIFPSIQHVRSHEMRGRIFQQAFGLDAQSALRMANSGSIPEIMKQMQQRGMSPAEQAAAQSATKEKAENLTLASDKTMSYFSNSVTAFGEAVTKFVDGSSKKFFADPTTNTGTPINKNKIIGATPLGPIFDGQQ